MASPPPLRRALLAGATGLVGRAMLPLLLRGHGSVDLLLRRAAPELGADPRLRPHVVDFARLADTVPAVDDVFIALGTTIAVAGSEAAFRAVDFDAVVATARAARAAGATRLALVSALGADAGSRVFYNRVKGETEAAVAGLGYASVTIARPSLLLGDREALGQPVRRMEALAMRFSRPLSRLVPRAVRPIAAADVAAALVAATARGEPGVSDPRLGRDAGCRRLTPRRPATTSSPCRRRATPRTAPRPSSRPPTTRRSSGRRRRCSQHRAFMRLWFARLAGITANQMLMVALGWQMYDLTGQRLGPRPGRPAAVPAGAGAGAGRPATWSTATTARRIVAACMAVQALVALLLALAPLGAHARQPRAAARACRSCSARCAPSRCRRSRR